MIQLLKLFVFLIKGHNPVKRFLLAVFRREAKIIFCFVGSECIIGAGAGNCKPAEFGHIKLYRAHQKGYEF